MSSVLPSDEEAARHVLTPASIVWRRAGDPRAMLGSGTALVLQVAHPVIAGGVREFSDFERDPWGRLLRTLDYVHLLVYGGSRTPAVGRALRGMHRSIRGVDPQGRRYHALEPRAYAWVHATLAHTMVGAHDRFGRPFTADQRERFWVDWRGLGRLLGIRERDLPADWAGFEAYRDQMIATELEDNDVVRAVMRTLAARIPPPGLSRRIWGAARLPAAHTMELATVALLPPAARSRLNLDWSAAQEAQMRVLGTVTRAMTPAMPRGVREMGPAYVHWRTAEIERGPFARREDELAAAA